jgi:hypothetical protein
VLKQAERPDDLGLWRLRFDDSQMDDYSGITIDNYNLTFNLPNTVNAERSLQEQAQVICFQVSYRVLMEELYSRVALVKVRFFSIMWHPSDARLARRPHSVFTGLE